MQASILIVPGYTGSGPAHWQTLWQRDHPQYIRVEQGDWYYPVCTEWVSAVQKVVEQQSGPIIFVCHSLGSITVAHWAHRHRAQVLGALLVVPADVEQPDFPTDIVGFAPIPLKPLPFRSIVVASADDPYLSVERGQLFARGWGSRFVNVGEAGHINTRAGFGPWPFGKHLLKELTGALPEGVAN